MKSFILLFTIKSFAQNVSSDVVYIKKNYLKYKCQIPMREEKKLFISVYVPKGWLIKNVPSNNRKVGVWGISYPGFYTTTALLSRYPVLLATLPQAPIANLYHDAI